MWKALSIRVESVHDNGKEKYSYAIHSFDGDKPEAERELNAKGEYPTFEEFELALESALDEFAKKVDFKLLTAA